MNLSATRSGLSKIKRSDLHHLATPRDGCFPSFCSIEIVAAVALLVIATVTCHGPVTCNGDFLNAGHAVTRHGTSPAVVHWRATPHTTRATGQECDTRYKPRLAPEISHNGNSLRAKLGVNTGHLTGTTCRTVAPMRRNATHATPREKSCCQAEKPKSKARPDGRSAFKTYEVRAPGLCTFAKGDGEAVMGHPRFLSPTPRDVSQIVLARR
jgi:hypothetical protein